MPENTFSSPQLDTFNPGTSPSQLQQEFIGLGVVNEPEEEGDMKDLKTGFLERHRERLYEAIDIVPPPTTKVCSERAQEDPVEGAPPSTMPQPDKVGPSVTVATQPDVARPSVAATVQLDATAPSNAPAVEKARGMEKGLDAAVVEGAQDEKSSLTPTAPPSWEEMMEMLKGVLCFTDAEAPSTKMSDFFPLTKRISVNMGGGPPTFVSAWLPFGTLSPSCLASSICSNGRCQRLQKW